MDAVQIKAEKLRSELLVLFNTNEIGFACSETNFGISCYLTIFNFKIRVSDHESTNSFRVENEIMFDFKIDVEKMVSKIEQIAFPDRFDFYPVERGQKPTHIKNGKPCVMKRK